MVTCAGRRGGLSFLRSSPSSTPFPIIHREAKHKNILQVTAVTFASRRPARRQAGTHPPTPVWTHVSRSRRARATAPRSTPHSVGLVHSHAPVFLPAYNFARRSIHAAAAPRSRPRARWRSTRLEICEGGRRVPQCCSEPGGTGSTGRAREDSGDGSASRTGAQRPGLRKKLLRAAASPQRSCSLRTEEALRLADRMAGARCLLEKPG